MQLPLLDLLALFLILCFIIAYFYRRRLASAKRELDRALHVAFNLKT